MGDQNNVQNGIAGVVNHTTPHQTLIVKSLILMLCIVSSESSESHTPIEVITLSIGCLWRKVSPSNRPTTQHEDLQYAETIVHNIGKASVWCEHFRFRLQTTPNFWRAP